jgi:hypothetical protein
MIYQMDPSGVFVNLDNFEGGVPNFTNLPLPPTVDGASPTTPLVADGRRLLQALFQKREAGANLIRRQKCKIAVVLVSQKGSFG